MTTAHYRAQILTSATPATCFDAVTTGYGNWWTTPDAPLQNLRDRAKFTFPPGTSYWTFEATFLEPHACVEMRCVEALHLHEGQPDQIEQEWLGTTLRWSIVPKGNQTLVTLDHIGLKPQLLCYTICKAGWDFFVLDSLKAYLQTGTGTPHKAPAERA